MVVTGSEVFAEVSSRCWSAVHRGIVGRLVPGQFRLDGVHVLPS